MNRAPAPESSGGRARLVGTLVVVTIALGWWTVELKGAGNEQGAGVAVVGAFLTGMWALLAGVTAKSSARAAREKALREQYPDEPWHWKEEWHAGEISGGAKGEAIALSLFALVFMGLSAPAVWAIPAELRKGNHLILLVLLFWVVGLVMLRSAWKRWAHHRRLGTLVFRPDPLPGSWGGFVGGVVHIPHGAEVAGDVTLKLRNVRETVSGSGKNRRTRDVVIWETGTVLDDEKLAHRAALRDVPVLFQVPRGKGEPTDESNPQARVIWRLQITAPLRGGGKLDTTFAVPVFDRGEDLALGVAPAPLLESEVVRRPDDFMREAGVTESVEAGVRIWRIDQPAARKAAWLQLVILLVLGGVTAAGIPVISWFTGAFMLLPLFIFLSTAWPRAECRLDDTHLHLTRFTWRGPRRAVVPLAEVGDLTLTRSMETGGEQFWRLHLLGKAGVDVEAPHALEHFAARKARHRWRKDASNPAAARALQETPRFRVEVAGFLKNTQAAEQVKDHLLAAILEKL